ncbi:MAG: cell surface protein SprA, partial [Prevotellaceae bacterium]|nr:cell surface protein SprA [Prevotellaceae bacterium]
RFASSYNWARGLALTDGIETGNTITNQRSIDVNGRFNLETLYNKVPFLKNVNRRFSASYRKPADNRQNARQPRTDRGAANAQGNVQGKDSLSFKKSIKKNPEERWAYKLAQYVARLAMSVRNVSLTYKNTYAMTLPGFRPEAGDLFGQKKRGGMLAPGLGFAFGMTGDSYIEQALERGWLVCNDSVVTPATTNALEDVQLRATIEPWRDFKIDLTAMHTRNSSRSVQYMFDGMPETRSGNFTMSIVSIGSALEGSSARNGYRSPTFERFRRNLDIMQQRVEAQYLGARYPQGTSLAGETFDPANGTVSKYSPDVMIPAFLAAYTGKDAAKSTLSLFPGILSMMPNWRITYSGLGKLPFLKNTFRSVNLNHAYRSSYTIGSYNTFQSFRSYMGDLGFMDDVQTGNPVPTSRFDVSMVAINEQFSPLIGIDATLQNGLTAKLEYKTTRVLNLSLAALQLVETASRDFVVGIGYKLMNFRLFTARNAQGSKTDISHDLTLRADVSFRNQSALARDIVQGTTQATSGNRALKISCSADYQLSKLLTLRVYYDRQQNTPLVSTTAYPVVSADFGVSMKFSLTR